MKAAERKDHGRDDQASASAEDAARARPNRATAALHAEERCSDRGHPLTAAGECPCGAVRYD
ncbi:MAG TPA: hypothetical protein VHB21_07240 [Minicystis sp.]|nr:hypothetical protein [Minicystis sp.]